MVGRYRFEYRVTAPSRQVLRAGQGVSEQVMTRAPGRRHRRHLTTGIRKHATPPLLAAARSSEASNLEYPGEIQIAGMIMKNFAYGSNLSIDYVHDYCPSATFVMRAALPNYRIEFRRYSENLKGGISSIIEAPGELIRGVIYDIALDEILALDELENVPEGIYRRDTFLVLGEDNVWHEADLYRVTSPDGPFTPSIQYVDLMVAGASQHNLDADYVECLQMLRDSLD